MFSLWDRVVGLVERQTGRLRGRRLALLTALVLSALPLVRMVRVVRRSSLTQYNDYWPMLDSLLRDDGGLRVRGLVELRNEHPVFLPKLAYWLNVELFHGSNHSLAFLVIAIVALQVVLVGLLAARTPGMGRWAATSLVVTASSLLFARNGAWNFVKAMSGTAWLSANLWALAALLAQERGRRFLVPLLGLLATFSYGTGLIVWPALTISALVRGPRVARTQWPTYLAGSASLVWYGLWYRSRPSLPFASRPSLIEVSGRTLEGVGSVMAEGTAARVLGAAAMALIATGTVRLRSRLGAAAPWIGLAAFGLGGSALIALGRYTPGADFGASRYSSLSALTWIAAAGLLLLSLPPRPWVALLPLPIVVAVAVGGSASVEDLKPATLNHDLLAVAIRIDVADRGQVQGGLRPFPPITERLEQTGHYPFTDDFPFACGELGRPVATSSDQVIAGQVEPRSEPRAPEAESLVGTLGARGRSVECIVVLDASDVVVGAGVPRPRTPGGRLPFETIAPRGAGHAVYVRFESSDTFVPLVGG